MICHLSPEDYKIAENNGIERKDAYVRFYELGWDIERAITEPVNKKVNSWSKDWNEWKDVAEKNGVSLANFRERLKLGWGKERAATTPISRANNKRLYSVFAPEQISTMRDNGIPLSAAYLRVTRLKWTIEDAISKPLRKTKRHG